jgi:hypothetical protein
LPDTCQRVKPTSEQASEVQVPQAQALVASTSKCTNKLLNVYQYLEFYLPVVSEPCYGYDHDHDALVSSIPSWAGQAGGAHGHFSKSDSEEMTCTAADQENWSRSC